MKKLWLFLFVGVFMLGIVSAAEVNWASSAMVTMERSPHGADGYVVTGDAGDINDGDIDTSCSQYSHDGGYATVEAILNFSGAIIPIVDRFSYTVRGARTENKFYIKTEQVPVWTLINDGPLVPHTRNATFDLDGPFYNVTDVKLYVRSNSDNEPYYEPYGVGINEIEIWDLDLVVVPGGSITNNCSFSDQTIMKLNSPSNSHGALWDDIDYGWDICYDDIFDVAGTGNRICNGNTLLWLSDTSNAKAENPNTNLYSEEVCYGNLSCRVVDEGVGEYCSGIEKEVVALYNDSNSLLSDPNYLPNGTVGYWKFDGDANGAVGSDGTANGGVSFVDGQVRQAGDFDGVDDYVTIADDDSLDFGDGDFSIEFWIKQEEPIFPHFMEYISKRGESCFWDSHFDIRGMHPDRSKISFGLNDGNYSMSVHSGSVSDDKWHHVVFMRDGDFIRAFTDGVLTNSSSLVGDHLLILGGSDTPLLPTSRVGNISNDMPIRIGEGPCTSTGGSGDGDNTSMLNGSMDEVVVYNRALNAEEVKGRYNVGAYEKKICCKSVVASVQELYWAWPDGVRITTEKPNVGDTIQAVKTGTSSGTFTIKDAAWIDELARDIVGDGSSGNLIGEWKITQADLDNAGGKDNIYFIVDGDGNDKSNEISINGTYDDSLMDVTIVSPACGSNYSEGDNVMINITATDKDNFLNGSVSIGGVVVNTFVNGGVIFSYNFSVAGNVQIVAEAVNDRDNKRARHISNVMILGGDGNYVAACIDKPKDFSDMEESTVDFDASTTRAIVVSGDSKTPYTPMANSENFSWYWNFMPENIDYPTAREKGTLLEYKFTTEFPIAGDNSAGLRVEFN